MYGLGLLEAVALLRFLFGRHALLAEVDVAAQSVTLFALGSAGRAFKICLPGLVVHPDDGDDFYAADAYQLAHGPARD